MQKPLIANSDTHHLWQMGRHYSIVEPKEKTKEGVIEALKFGNVTLKPKLLPTWRIIHQMIPLVMFVLLGGKAYKQLMTLFKK